MKRRSSRVAATLPKRYRELSPKETADDLALQYMLRRDEFQARDGIGGGLHLAVGELDPSFAGNYKYEVFRQAVNRLKELAGIPTRTRKRKDSLPASPPSRPARRVSREQPRSAATTRHVAGLLIGDLLSARAQNMAIAFFSQVY